MVQYLYHYTSAQSLLYIIEGGSIWSTKIQYMNDSKEFTHAIDLANRFLNRIVTSSTDSKINEICDKISEVLERISGMNVFVTCFSEVHDALGQWRGYCPASSGYCIGFNAKDLEAQASEQNFVLKKCIYNSSEKENLISRWVNEFVKILSSVHTHHQDLETIFWQYESGYVNEFINMASVMKHDAFSDEKEWRLISIVNTDHEKMGLRAGKSLLIPYVPISLDYSRDKKLLWNLTVGPTPQIDMAMNSATILFKKACFQNGVIRTMIPYRDW